MLAMAVGDEIHVVRLDRSLDGETVAASLGPIRRLAASPDERLLALGREDGTIVVWDVRAERVLQTLSGHRSGGVRPGFRATARRRAGWFRWAGTAWSRSGTPRPEANPCARWIGHSGSGLCGGRPARRPADRHGRRGRHACAPGTLPRGEPTSLRSTTAPRFRPWPMTPPARPWPRAAWIARFGSGPPHPAGGAWGPCPTRTSSRASPSAPTAGSWREAVAQRTREAGS